MIGKLDDGRRCLAKSTLERVSIVAGIAGSLVTVALTAWNAQTKGEIDASQVELKRKSDALDAEIRRRDATVEESKERVERYKWVYSLVPSLTGADPVKRNAALAMVRLALSTDEAQALLTGLQQSPSPEVRQAATQGFKEIAAIADAEIAQLVLQMNSQNADERKRATGRLEAAFADSPKAIALVLDRVQGDNLASLSPSGLINTLYYLARTNPQAWTADNARTAEAALAALRDKGPMTAATPLRRPPRPARRAGRRQSRDGRSPWPRTPAMPHRAGWQSWSTGPQTKAELARLEAVLAKVPR